MSVLIDGMDMPKSCAECRLKHYGLEGLKCSAKKRMFYRGRDISNVVDECTAFRHPCCPLIPIKGRLIYENDVCNIIDRFIGYLDDDMVFRIKTAIKCHTKSVVKSEEDT